MNCMVFVSVDCRVCGGVDCRMCGCGLLGVWVWTACAVGVWTTRCVGLYCRVCGLQGVWVCGLQGVWVWTAGVWKCGLQGVWFRTSVCVCVCVLWGYYLKLTFLQYCFKNIFLVSTLVKVCNPLLSIHVSRKWLEFILQRKCENDTSTLKRLHLIGSFC